MHTDCAICLESIDSKASIETLCSHTFHKDCLCQVQVHEHMGVVYIQCPLCRQHIPPISKQINDTTYHFLRISLGIVISGFIGATSFWLLLRYASLS